ncbi:hypothetical protein O3M35_008729 [Rhynocoris fuscipes]|uniref:Proteasome subunit alpha type-5 n=1 Tax=Rhynocoris fuscipes TaxID=488301 RepID=A0AAW1D7B4_9HEMI
MVTSTIEKILEVDHHIGCAASSNLAIRFGDTDYDHVAMSRPFGVAIMFAGYDETGPQLYHMDPSGTFLHFDAKAIGAGSEGAQQSLQEHYNKSMSLKEAIKTVLLILKQVMEETLKADNVEIATVTKDRLFHMFTKDEVEAEIQDLGEAEL